MAKRRALFGADALLCIPENTRDDLLERRPALADRGGAGQRRTLKKP